MRTSKATQSKEELAILYQLIKENVLVSVDESVYSEFVKDYLKASNIPVDVIFDIRVNRKRVGMAYKELRVAREDFDSAMGLYSSYSFTYNDQPVDYAWIEEKDRKLFLLNRNCYPSFLLENVVAFKPRRIEE